MYLPCAVTDVTSVCLEHLLKGIQFGILKPTAFYQGRERERAWGPSSGRGVWGMSVFLCGQGQCLVGVYDHMIHVHVIVPVYFSLVFSFLVALKC